MKNSSPPASAVVRNETRRVEELFQRHVMPTYGRFELALSHGSGSYVYDVQGRRYLDLGGGIAVNCLGHAHPELTEALIEQSRRLTHVSNLYYYEPQGRLAAGLTERLGPGKVFFCNSGAEANEGLFKLARRFGHEEGRFEILTAHNSFHGRTLAGIAATGQEKVKQGFGPQTPGFRHAAFNDLESFQNAVSPATAAILIEGVQGESGVVPAKPDFLLGLRRLCDERGLLLLIDGVQCGHFRTGRFQSYQRLLEGRPEADEFRPDGVAMAKSLAAGFPMGAFWVREPYADLLGPGSHGTTYGGNLLGCAVANKTLEIIQRDQLDRNARKMGELLKSRLEATAAEFPNILKEIRGLGLMVGLAFQDAPPGLKPSGDRAVSLQMTDHFHHAGLLTIPAGGQVVRLLPPLNLSESEAADALRILHQTIQSLNAASE